MENYQSQAVAFLSNSETFERYIDSHSYSMALNDFLVAAEDLEATKKTIFYGKNLPDTPAAQPIVSDNTDILHAKLGIIGEAREIYLANTPEEVLDESGDMLWYVAVLLHRHGYTLEEAMQYNIDKLSSRYASGKFTATEAINRANVA